MCLCLCRFLSRPDVKALKMAEFLDWALKVVSMSDSTCVHSLSLHPVFLPDSRVTLYYLCFQYFHSPIPFSHSNIFILPFHSPIQVFSFSHFRDQYAGDDPAIWSPLHFGKFEEMLSILPPLPSTSFFSSLGLTIQACQTGGHGAVCPHCTAAPLILWTH